MSKDEILNQRIPEDREPETVTVDLGDELWTVDPEEVEELIITSGGGIFVVHEGKVLRYNPHRVVEMAYEDTGLDQEEGEDDE